MTDKGKDARSIDEQGKSQQPDTIARSEYFYHVTWPLNKESICNFGLHPGLAMTFEGVNESYKSDDGSWRNAIYFTVLENIFDAFQINSSKRPSSKNTEWVIFRIPARYLSKCDWEHDESFPSCSGFIKVHQQVQPEHLEMTVVNLNVSEHPCRAMVGIAIDIVQTAAWQKVVPHCGE